MSTIRRRHDAYPPEADPASAPNQKLAQEDRGSFSVLDILRVLGGLLLLSGALSYFVTGTSFTWKYRPAWTRPAVVKAWLRGPISLTPAELALYNGTDSSLPIYLAVNGSIYDVSASPAFYGPGGSYHFFAGQDGTRAFVTGCFEQDITPDLRGVEEMFLPDESADAEGEKGTEGKGERKKRREQERRMARKKVRESVAHWERFFADNGKYHKIGTVKREEGWLEKLPRRELCEPARKKRPTGKPTSS